MSEDHRKDPPGIENLLHRCRSGDERAWRTLYRWYARSVGRFLLFRGVALQDVEDLVHDVLTAAVEDLDDYRGDSTFHVWLYSIARNKALTKSRDDRRAVLKELEYRRLVQEDRTPYECGEPVARVLGADVVGIVDGALSSMNPKFREVFLLIEIEGMEPIEVARSQGVPPSTVRARLRRARRAIARRLECAGYEPVRSADPDRPDNVTPIDRGGIGRPQGIRGPGEKHRG